MSKIMYAEITALSNKWGFCTANNNYFADLYDVSPLTVSRWFSQLAKNNYVRVEIDAAKGNERKVYPNDQNVNTYIQKDQEGIDEKIKRGIDEKIKYNNTSINTTSIIEKDAPTKTKKFTPPTQEETITYFLKKQSNKTAAETFHDHFSSNGWKVGGRAKMKDWKASARNWIRRDNSGAYNRKPKQLNAHLHVATGEEYNRKAEAAAKAQNINVIAI